MVKNNLKYIIICEPNLRISVLNQQPIFLNYSMSNKEIFKAIDIARKQRIGHYHPPFRVGRKQKRVVLDNRGYEVVKFNYGDEEMAQDYCNYLNNK